jgi:type II secretory pathway component PulF
MPSFHYVGLDEQGQSTSGTISAPSRSVAMQRIRSQGKIPTELHASSGSKAPKKSQSETAKDIEMAGRPTIPKVELANLIREIATAVEAGLPLMQGLQTVRRQAAGKKQAVILDFLIERLESGRPLHEACQEYGAPFDDMITGMIRAADASGRMHEVLHQLSDLLERSVELRREMLGALVYPAIVASLIGASVIVFITVILPKLMDPLTRAGVELPWPTKALLGIADFIGAWWWLIIIAGIGATYLWRAWSSQASNRRIIDRTLLSIPVLGQLLRDLAVARFTRTLGTLVSAGIPILSALKIVRDTLGNTVLMDAIDQVQERVSTGGSLATPLEQCGYFPPLLIQIVNIGERSGRLESMLLHASGAFDRQVDNSLKLFTKALPPVILMIMAVVAGFVLTAILLPLLDMQEAVAGQR